MIKKFKKYIETTPVEKFYVDAVKVSIAAFLFVLTLSIITSL